MQSFTVNRALLNASRFVAANSTHQTHSLAINTHPSSTPPPPPSDPTSPTSTATPSQSASRSGSPAPASGLGERPGVSGTRRKSTGSLSLVATGAVRAQLRRPCLDFTTSTGRRQSFNERTLSPPRRPNLRLTRLNRTNSPVRRAPSPPPPAPISAPVTRPVTPAPSVFEEDDEELPLFLSQQIDMAATGPVDTSARLTSLRRFMSDNGVNVYLVPTEDAHASEYITPADARRSHITGFTGSAGTAVVLPDQGLLFTDGRYFNQASKQLHPDSWSLMKQGVEGVPTWQEYLVKQAKQSKKEGKPPLRIGVDPELISASDASALYKDLKPHDAILVPLRKNLVDAGWGSDRPSRPHKPVTHLPDEIAGQSAKSKLAALRAELAKRENVAGTVVTSLDDVAWLFNLRGSDIAFNPVFFAYAWVGAKDEGDVTLFVESKQLDATPGVASYLEQVVGVKVQPYDAVWEKLKAVGKEAKANGEKVVISTRASLAVQDSLGGGADGSVVDTVRSMVGDLKAIKNEVEIEGFRQAHLRDGAALVSYFAWLEETLTSPSTSDQKLTEWAAAEELERRRKDFGGDKFRGLSFDTISSTGKNAAIIHYSPDPEGSAVVEKEEVYLCDSGAQYVDGTTDVTRTLHFGTPTEEQIRAFTRVLQGHIAIDSAVFPKGTTGYVLDAFARRALWSDGLDYRHGTGHGVGHFCNVHEGPQGIGTRIAYNEVPLKEGMTVSNEPGYYKDESFGIRIENVVVVRKAETRHNFGDKGYLGFERFTMCPIQTKLVDVELLSKDERGWLNVYHEEVLEKLRPLLGKDERGLKWLEKECKAI